LPSRSCSPWTGTGAGSSRAGRATRTFVRRSRRRGYLSLRPASTELASYHLRLAALVEETPVLPRRPTYCATEVWRDDLLYALLVSDPRSRKRLHARAPNSQSARSQIVGSAAGSASPYSGDSSSAGAPFYAVVWFPGEADTEAQSRLRQQISIDCRSDLKCRADRLRHFKAQRLGSGNLEGRAGSGIATFSGRPLLDRETAKTIDDDIVATFCSLDDLSENRIDDFFSLRFRQVVGFRYGLYEFSCIQVFILQQNRSLPRRHARCDARAGRTTASLK
jgi:hypothetical protein